MIAIDISNSTLYLNIDGNLDAFTVEILKDELDHLGQQPKDIILDMNGIEFVDFYGVDALLNLSHCLNQSDCHLEIEGIHGQPLQFIKQQELTHNIAIREQQILCH